MDFEKQLAAIGKSRASVITKLKKIYDATTEEEVSARLGAAWARPGCWEFEELFQKTKSSNDWLAPWFRSYAGVEDPDGYIGPGVVEEFFTIPGRFEKIHTPELARQWADAHIKMVGMARKLGYGRER